MLLDLIFWSCNLDSFDPSIRQREQHREADRYKGASITPAEHHLLIPLLEGRSFGPDAMHTGLSDAK